jgi:transcriptional regulator with XRE-family HTH domain
MRKLKEVCLIRGYSQDDIFLGTRIDRAKYSRIERGGLDPTVEDRQVLCRFFRMTEDELFPEYKDAGPEFDRDLFRKLKKHITITEKIELLGNNADYEAYHKKLIALAEKHGIEKE